MAKVLQSLIPIVDQSVSNLLLIYITFLSQKIDDNDNEQGMYEIESWCDFGTV